MKQNKNIPWFKVLKKKIDSSQNYSNHINKFYNVYTLEVTMISGVTLVHYKIGEKIKIIFFIVVQYFVYTWSFASVIEIKPTENER